MKNILSLLLRFGLSGLLLWYLFRKIDWQLTVETLKSADLIYLLMAGVIFLITNAIIACRWFIFIKALKLKVRTLEVIRYFFIGLFGNLFLPSAIGGDIIKIVGLCRASNEKQKVVASILLDRLSGFAAVAFIAVVAFLFGLNAGLIDDLTLCIPVAILGLGSLTIALLIFHEGLYTFGCRVFNFLPKVKQWLIKLHYDIALLKGERAKGLTALLLSGCGQTLLALVFFFIAKSLHQDVNLLYFFIFVPLICVASSVPSIGGLGVREAGTAYLFGKVGVQAGVSVSMSLILFLFMVVVGLIGGMVYVFTLSSGRLQHHSQNAVASSET